MRKLLMILFCAFPIWSIAQTTSENYVKTTAYQVPTQTGNVGLNDRIEQVMYYDGLGRVKQQIALRAGNAENGNTTPNLLDWESSWTVGSGSVAGFNATSGVDENNRILYQGPYGNQEVVWRCGNDASSNHDGGWVTGYIPIDRTKTYRFQVWAKKTGHLTNGHNYLSALGLTKLTGETANAPYFFLGDFPSLDEWYLMVGVIHPSDYTGGDTGTSGVYDQSGVKVKNGTEFKWGATQTNIRLRSFFYGSNDTNAKLYLSQPRFQIGTGSGTTIPSDIISHSAYDNFGRQTKQYLPYASGTTTGGNIYQDPLTEIYAFYDTYKYENTENPNSETRFEASPLQRPQEQGAPGISWIINHETDTDHTIKMEYHTNVSADNVFHYKVEFSSGNTNSPTLAVNGIIANGELQKNVVKDENWAPSSGNDHTMIEFTNKRGQLILKRAYVDSETHDTYYIYDDFGNLTYVLSPEGSLQIMNGENLVGNALEILDRLCYQYVHDHRNRLIEKKVPGKGKEYILYDKLDRPVLTQDANLRASNRWLFTKYDDFDRVAYTGSFYSKSTKGALQNAIDAQSIWNETQLESTFNIDGEQAFYTNSVFPNSSIILYTINYYDGYVDHAGMVLPSEVYGQTRETEVRGLPTVSKVRVLGTKTTYWITSLTGYDAKARSIYSRSVNPYLHTDDTVESLLDFIGKPLEVHTLHVKENHAPVVTTDYFSYDHQRRLIRNTQQIGEETPQLIAHHVYDNLGQTDYKLVGGDASPDDMDAYLQKVDYEFNVRGWLTDINNVDVNGFATALGENENDLFHFRINYDGHLKGFAEGNTENVVPLYNGNISQTIWKTDNVDDQKRSYGYTYDALNRIKGAFSRKGTTLVSNDHYKLWDVNYDKNGNINTLKRNGINLFNGTSLMDNLSYTYEGNQLLSVTDNAFSPIQQEGFKDGNTSGSDYTYDANGNMKSDANKGITKISYNHLNLPIRLLVDNNNGEKGSISYVYDATGMKLSKTVQPDTSTGIPPKTTGYAGRYLYETELGQEVLKMIFQPEGYIESDGSSGYTYAFQYLDHLGNVRLTYADFDGNGTIDSNTEIIEENHYYPFGLKQKGYNPIVQNENTVATRFKYNGIELEETFGVDLYEMDLRQYNPAIARWTGIDPVTHHSMSTYTAFDNNPIFWADPSGADAVYNWTGPNKGKYTDGDEVISFEEAFASHGLNVDGSQKSNENTSDGSSNNTDPDDAILIRRQAKRLGGNSLSYTYELLNDKENLHKITLFGVKGNIVTTIEIIISSSKGNPKIVSSMLLSERYAYFTCNRRSCSDYGDKYLAATETIAKDDNFKSLLTDYFTDPFLRVLNEDPDHNPFNGSVLTSDIINTINGVLGGTRLLTQGRIKPLERLLGKKNGAKNAARYYAIITGIALGNVFRNNWDHSGRKISFEIPIE